MRGLVVVAAVVFVHGIGQEQFGPATLDAQWRTALADGVWKAGDADLAERLRRPAGLPGALDTDMAFYADLFDPPDRQGVAAASEGLGPTERHAVEQLATVLLKRAALAAGRPEDRRTAVDERHWLAASLGRPGAGGWAGEGGRSGATDAGGWAGAGSRPGSTGAGGAGGWAGAGREVQGVGNVARSALAALARLRWFAPFGMAAARRFVVRSLVQVVRYLNEPELRERVQQRVADLVDENTRVLVGHSLGSVVAYEAAARAGSRIPLLVTLGSPLGIRTLVYDRLCPQPPVFPGRADRWVNVAAEDDIVAAVPDLTQLFAAGLSPGVFENRAVDNGSAAHDATHYLTKAEVGGPIAAVLRARPT